MANPNEFLAKLAGYDTQNVSPGILKKLRKVTSAEDFTPPIVKAKSCAASSLCAWVLAIEEIAKH